MSLIGLLKSARRNAHAALIASSALFDGASNITTCRSGSGAVSTVLLSSLSIVHPFGATNVLPAERVRGESADNFSAAGAEAEVAGGTDADEAGACADTMGGGAGRGSELPHEQQTTNAIGQANRRLFFMNRGLTAHGCSVNARAWVAHDQQCLLWTPLRELCNSLCHEPWIYVSRVTESVQEFVNFVLGVRDTVPAS